jgi:hypothetical protein
MFQFPGFASPTYGFSGRYRRSGGLPHSEIHGSRPARGSPWLIATCCVLHRLSVPRHPPDALQTLDLNSTFSERHAQGQTRTSAIVEKMHHARPNRMNRLSHRSRHDRNLWSQRITLSGHPLVTYPLHNVNRSRIGAHTMRKHKPLPSRDTPAPVTRRPKRDLMRRDAETAARRYAA